MMRVAQDDAAAFAELVGRYEARLVRLMRTIGPRADQAEDLSQETFLRLYRARHRYVPAAKFSTYLYTIAGNVARNAARSLGRRHEVSEADAPGTSQDPDGPPSVTAAVADASGLMPTRLMEKDERAAMVRRAVDSLGDRQKMALMLSRFEHLSYAEIAESMDLSTKAVKSLLSRARVAVKEQLAAYVEEGAEVPRGEGETTTSSQLFDVESLSRPPAADDEPADAPEQQS